MKNILLIFIVSLGSIVNAQTFNFSCQQPFDTCEGNSEVDGQLNRGQPSDRSFVVNGNPLRFIDTDGDGWDCIGCLEKQPFLGTVDVGRDVYNIRWIGYLANDNRTLFVLDDWREKTRAYCGGESVVYTPFDPVDTLEWEYTSGFESDHGRRFVWDGSATVSPSHFVTDVDGVILGGSETLEEAKALVPTGVIARIRTLNRRAGHIHEEASVITNTYTASLTINGDVDYVAPRILDFNDGRYPVEYHIEGETTVRVFNINARIYPSRQTWVVKTEIYVGI